MADVSVVARDYLRTKVVIVSGAASGIGAELTRTLARVGATVIATDIDEAGLDRVREHLGSDAHNITCAPLDVRDRAAWDELTLQVVREHRRIDLVFNNAGVAVGGDSLEVSREQFAWVLDVNLWGVINGTLSCAQHMVRAGSGHIVNIASMYGLFPGPFETAYVTSKHAVVGFSTSLRAELQERGVSVSVVCPGNIETPIWQSSVLVGNVPREDAIRVAPFRSIPVDQAARQILEGVARNQAIVVFPRQARFTWWLYRLSPSWLIQLTLPHVRAFRALQLRTRGTLRLSGKPRPSEQ